MKVIQNILRFFFVLIAAGLAVFSCPNSAKEPPVITITTQPASTTNVTEGSISGNLSVSAVVTLSETLNYQWQQSDMSNFASATNVGINNPTLAIPTGLTAGIYYFRCVVSADGAESKTSDTAIVNVAAIIPVITITAQPTPTTNVTAGNISGNLIVSAAVTPIETLNYQWQQSDMSDFTDMINVGTSDTTLAIPTGLSAGIYYFRCVVSAAGAESKTSDTATVNVAAAPVPVITINTQPTATTNVTVGSISGNLTVSAAVTPSETLNYQWQQSDMSDFSIGANVGTNNPILAIPAGLTAGTYYFRCTVSAAGAVFVNSNTAIVIAAVNPLPVQMILVPGGSFTLGKELNTANGSDVTPVSTVTLTGFYIGKYQVTQAQYQAVMKTNPSTYTTANGNPPAAGETDANRPVETVNWYDALVFCNMLSISEGLTPAYIINGSTDPSVWGAVPGAADSTWDAAAIVSGSAGYRLPTEAQWEYAAKGGNGSPGSYSYSGSNNVDEVAWYWNNGGSKTHEVGKKLPNGLGTCDMTGNVGEWCWDWYGTYDSTAKTDPSGASSGTYRSVRGGSWNSEADAARMVHRFDISPYIRNSGNGFRVVLPGAM